MSRLRVALLLVLAACAPSSSAHAQLSGGFDLSWNDCIGLPGAAQNIEYACDGSDGNSKRLVVTFVPPMDLTAFVGVQLALEMRTPLPVLPDWWRFGDLECRGGGLVFPAPRGGIGTGATGACIDPWISRTTGGGYAWTSEMGIDCFRTGCGTYPNAARGALQLAFASDTEIPLQAGQRYLLPPIRLDPIDSESCPGCATPACFYVQRVELYQTVGQPPPQQDIYWMDNAIERQFVTWQAGAGNACPLEVPTRRVTWGAIKGVYR